MKINIKDKTILRKIYFNKLKNISFNNFQKWNLMILQKFQKSNYFQNNQIFAAYYSLKYEVNTIPIIELLWKNNKKVCLPRMNNNSLDFYYINSWDNIIFDNNYQIGQPNLNCKKIKNNQINCILIPLIAFDKNYYRIGHGKGFYNNYLFKNKFNFIKIGLGFLIQSIPYIINHDIQDIPLDIIITNN